MTKVQKHAIELLLVEDNLADIHLTTEVFAEGTIRPNLKVVRNGIEALEYLRGDSHHAKASLPKLILLDLNLPKINGRELLVELKQDPDLKSIPVLVLTTSQAPLDIQDCYNLHANCYVIKPSNIEDFASTVRSIEEFWLTCAKLPGS